MVTSSYNTGDKQIYSDRLFPVYQSSRGTDAKPLTLDVGTGVFLVNHIIRGSNDSDAC